MWEGILMPVVIGPDKYCYEWRHIASEAWLSDSGIARIQVFCPIYFGAPLPSTSRPIFSAGHCDWCLQEPSADLRKGQSGSSEFLDIEMKMVKFKEIDWARFSGYPKPSNIGQRCTETSLHWHIYLILAMCAFQYMQKLIYNFICLFSKWNEIG